MYQRVGYSLDGWLNTRKEIWRKEEPKDSLKFYLKPFWSIYQGSLDLFWFWINNNILVSQILMILIQSLNFCKGVKVLLFQEAPKMRDFWKQTSNICWMRETLYVPTLVHIPLHIMSSMQSEQELSFILFLLSKNLWGKLILC